MLRALGREFYSNYFCTCAESSEPGVRIRFRVLGADCSYDLLVETLRQITGGMFVALLQSRSVF